MEGAGEACVARECALVQHDRGQDCKICKCDDFHSCIYCFYLAKAHTAYVQHVSSHRNVLELITVEVDLAEARDEAPRALPAQAFRCEHCKFKSSTKLGLDSHIGKVHKNVAIAKYADKKFHCPLCPYRGGRRNMCLISHMRRHHANATHLFFTCDLCGTKCLSKQGLWYHKLFKHADSV